jgi:hypothetical protein
MPQQTPPILDIEAEPPDTTVPIAMTTCTLELIIEATYALSVAAEQTDEHQWTWRDLNKQPVLIIDCDDFGKVRHMQLFRELEPGGRLRRIIAAHRRPT